PEVYLGEPGDHYADIYSLAMTAVYCFDPQCVLKLTARDGGDISIVIRALGCSEALKNVLARALSTKKKRRFGSMEEFRRALESAGVNATPRLPPRVEHTAPRAPQAERVEHALQTPAPADEEETLGGAQGPKPSPHRVTGRMVWTSLGYLVM